LGAVGEVDGFALIRGRRQLLAPTYQLGALVESGTFFGAGESFSTPSRMRSAPVLAPNASPINLPSMASSGAVIDEWADIDDEIASDVASGSSPTVSALKWRLIAAEIDEEVEAVPLAATVPAAGHAASAPITVEQGSAALAADYVPLGSPFGRSTVAPVGVNFTPLCASASCRNLHGDLRLGGWLAPPGVSAPFLAQLVRDHTEWWRLRYGFYEDDLVGSEDDFWLGGSRELEHFGKRLAQLCQSDAEFLEASRALFELPVVDDMDGVSVDGLRLVVCVPFLRPWWVPEDAVDLPCASMLKGGGGHRVSRL
jgi:hypothetical protein